MSIFSFEDGDSIGEVVRIETNRVWVRVTSPEKLRLARMGRLVAAKAGDANQWVVGMVEKVWRLPLDIDEVLEEENGDIGEATGAEDNGIRVVLVGTYRAVHGTEKDVFTRAVMDLPCIDEQVFPIEEVTLEKFMGIISRTGKAGSEAPLALGTFALDPRAIAYVDGNKLFQRHAAIVGSTGAGKSWTVAALLERAAGLPSANVVLFDLHGEYKSLSFARQLKIAGPGDAETDEEGVIFLPYWLLNYEEMQDMFVERSDEQAYNQAMIFSDTVRKAKLDTLQALGKEDVIQSFTIDSPVPFDIEEVVSVIRDKNKEMVDGAKEGTKKQGDFYGKFSRFLLRLESKVSDRRYSFMYRGPNKWRSYEALHRLGELLLGGGAAGEGAEATNSGVKVVDFSEVPSDVLPVIVSLVARLVFQIQFWTGSGGADAKRHPVLMVCDEAHLYLPSARAEANPLEKRALASFERIAKEGRKYGVGLLVVSQRPADVSATILSQCNNFISLRLTNGEDQAVVRRLMPETLSGLLQLLPTLDIGEAVVIGDAILLPTRVKLTRPQHEPLSGTVDFWTEWSGAEAKRDIVGAVENLRRQCRGPVCGE